MMTSRATQEFITEILCKLPEGTTLKILPLDFLLLNKGVYLSYFQ